MTEMAALAAVAVASGIAAWAGTGALIPLLRRAAVLDRPNERSLHVMPTPRGGGIAVIAAVLCGWAVLSAIGPVTAGVLVVALAAAALAAVSWLDDLHTLSPAIRLLAQLAAVVVGMAALPQGGVAAPDWLPGWIELAATAVLWLWFVNLFNFMDGIDGIAGSEAAAIAIGLALFAMSGTGRDPGVAAMAGAVAAAAIGFLAWNWAPAKIFLGDVGSVPLGYLLGFLLLLVAARGHWKIALILPLYFLADATITLLRRLARGERVWQAHRQHFYQRAVQRGLSHAQVVRRVIAADLVLIGSGWAAENGAGLAALGVAAATVLGLLAALAGMPRRRAA